jgi:SAM-dependent methyltransferase
MERSTRGFWDQIALRWRFAEPITPCHEDIWWYEREAGQRVRGRARALLLGVTAGIASMQWPQSTVLTAVDWSTNMLKNVWPAGDTPASSAPACADWRELPIAGGCIDLVVGDGCYAALSKTADATLFNAELGRVARPGGILLMRCFCRPPARLQAHELFERLFSGGVASLDLFRFLLAMALYEDAHTRVTRRAVWELWARHVPNARALQDRMGWTDDDLANMERIAAVDHTYYFPTLDELIELWRPHFALLSTDTPAYAWGELFPRVVLGAR